MLRLLVDSGSSIKQEELEYYNAELVPLKILMGETEYADGVNLPMDEFYRQLIDEKIFPKTSLPNLGELEERVSKYTTEGDEVIILTISSEISGSFNAIKNLFAENKKVKVIDSKMAVGGMRLIVDEINRNRELSLDEIEEKVNSLIPRIKIMAIPETLEYLFRGGRLSKKDWILGSILKIKPIIGFIDGKVKVLTKKIGLKMGMSYIAGALKEFECDENYEIIASYTYDKSNLEKLIEMTDEKYHKQIRVYDNLDPAIACHWGPNAFGYVFVANK
ncbi:MAG: DegV family protein [Clostridia bacterium]|jgi:DegV family protein with EDD domain|nr:DegV family protein [Clostridia bacterium]